MANMMKGAILPGNSTVELKDFEIPKPGHGQVLIKTKATVLLFTTFPAAAFATTAAADTTFPARASTVRHTAGSATVVWRRIFSPMKKT